ncbi:MAG: protein kinase domain-containing protein [Gemmatimonadales bacterium]
MSKPSLEGRVLGDRYTIERELGRGGMATVYLARDHRHNRNVAVKVLEPELAAMLGPERFLQEIQTVAALRHPNIVPLYDSGEAEGLLYYVMPWVTQASLRERIDRERQLPLEEALRVTQEIGEALGFAHQHGVVHRDIKPENIMFEAGHAVLCDFGIARAIDRAGGERITSTGLAVGTPAYMSPEQAVGEPVDARSDIYSLGCVLYEMLAGLPPHPASTPAGAVTRKLTEPAPSLRTIRPGIPVPVDTAISRALARVPADRFPTTLEFAHALESATVPLVPAMGKPAAFPRRLPRGSLPAAIGVLVLGVLGVVVLRSPRTSAEPVSPSRLAVFPFAVRSAGPHQYLGEGVVDLLSRDLDGMAGLRTVEPGTVLNIAGSDAADVIDLERGRSMARRLGAGLFVLGTVHSVAGQLQIRAQLFDRTAPDPVVQASVRGDTSEVFALVDRLAAELIVGARQGDPNRLAGTAALTTQSLPALKEYLNAEATLRNGSVDSAIAGYQRAIAIDSGFALAFYRLSVAAGWSPSVPGTTDRQHLAGPSLTRALATSDRLAGRDRRLLEAYAAFRGGQANEAEGAYRAILRDYPDDLEALFQLADVLYQYNPMRGRPITEAREPFDQVLDYDPGFL